MYVNLSFSPQLKNWIETTETNEHESKSDFLFNYDMYRRDMQIEAKITFYLSDTQQNGVTDNICYNTKIYCLTARFSILDSLLVKGTPLYKLSFRWISKCEKSKHQLP